MSDPCLTALVCKRNCYMRLTVSNVFMSSFYTFIHGSNPAIYSDPVNLSYSKSYRLKTKSGLGVNPSPG